MKRRRTGAIGLLSSSSTTWWSWIIHTSDEEEESKPESFGFSDDSSAFFRRLWRHIELHEVQAGDCSHSGFNVSKLYFKEDSVKPVAPVALISFMSLKLLQRLCCQDLRERQNLSLLQYGKASCRDWRAQGLHQRRCSDMFIGTLPDMVSSGRCPAWFHRDAARHVHRRRCSGMLVLTSLTPEGAVVRRACNRKEKVVESYGMRS